MAERKPLEELTLMDDYMFYAVMKRPDLLKKMLECILGIKIVDLIYSKGQETMKEGYDSRGIRLDVFVKDENGRWYNIEAQTTDKKDIAKRTRYNQAVVDVDTLKPGEKVTKLPECYVIFITSFDTHGKDKRLYWFDTRDRFEKDLLFGDGVNRVIVNITGNKGEVSQELLAVIEYLNTGVAGDEFTKELDAEVARVKVSDERKREYMTIVRYEDELRLDGEISGLVKGLRIAGWTDEAIREKIKTVYDLSDEEVDLYVPKPVPA